MTALSMMSHAYFMFQLQNTWLLWTSIGVTFGIEIYIFCCNGGRTFPSNMVLLGIFTFCEGYIVSFISSATGHQSGNGTVLLAAGLTMGNFKNNFSCCNCMYSLCLLHWRRLHNIFLGSYHSFSYFGHFDARHHVHRLSIYQKPLLWSWCSSLFNLFGHWYPTYHGRKKYVTQSGWICSCCFTPLYRYHSDFPLHSAATF